MNHNRKTTHIRRTAIAEGRRQNERKPSWLEKTEFDVVLTAVGDKKIQVIKAVKAITNAGLADAKAMVDGAPKAILEKAKKEDAEKAKAQLEEAGATVELK